MISEVHKLSEEKNRVQEESSENLEVCVQAHLGVYVCLSVYLSVCLSVCARARVCVCVCVCV